MAQGFVAEQFWQNLREFLSDGLNVDPAQPHKYFVTNEVGRALSYLMGWDKTTGRPLKIRVNAAGQLETVSAGTALTTNETTTLNLAPGANQVIAFATATNRLDIWAVGADLTVERSTDGVTYQNPITVFQGGYYSIDATQLQVRITNPAGSAANQTGQVVGWY